MVSPDGNVTIEPSGPDAESAETPSQDVSMDKGGARKVLLDEEDDEDEQSGAESPAPEDMQRSGGEVRLSEKDMMRAKRLIASGQEPTSITDKMLIEQYNQQEG